MIFVFTRIRPKGMTATLSTFVQASRHCRRLVGLLAEETTVNFDHCQPSTKIPVAHDMHHISPQQHPPDYYRTRTAVVVHHAEDSIELW